MPPSAVLTQGSSGHVMTAAGPLSGRVPQVRLQGGRPVALIDDARIIEFLDQPRNAIVATIRPNGIPQLSPIWFLWRTDRFVLSAGVSTAKAANLRRDPRISLCIDDEPGARYLTATGHVSQVDEVGRREHALELIAKYKPAEEVLA